MDKKLELEYHSSFENQRDSMIRYARLTGLDKHHSFLKKLGYGFLVFNVFLLLLVLFSSKPTSSSGYFLMGSVFS